MAYNRKQITTSNNKIGYGGFQARLVASLIDCILIGICFTPIFMLSSNLIYGGSSPVEMLTQAMEELGKINQNSENPINIIDFFKNNELMRNYFFEEYGMIKIIIDQAIQIIAVSASIYYFWIKRQATPGKILLSFKIVDEKTLNKPTNRQLLIRLLSYIISILPGLLGMVWIAFDSRKQGWHDKIAGTLVIKTKNK